MLLLPRGTWPGLRKFFFLNVLIGVGFLSDLLRSCHSLLSRVAFTFVAGFGSLTFLLEELLFICPNLAVDHSGDTAFTVSPESRALNPG